MAPDAPTLQELGIKMPAYDVQFMFAGPKGMPKEVVDAISNEIRKAAESEEIKDLIANKLDLDAVFVSGEVLEKEMKQSSEENKALVASIME